MIALSLAPQSAQAKDLLEKHEYWYEPQPMESIDAAASTIVSLQKFFVFYGGMNLDQIVVTREGLAIHASQTTVQQNSQYVPSYGGAWIGGQYVPYYGGTTVTSPVPVTSKMQEYVPLASVGKVGILYFPYMKLEWGVYFRKPDGAGILTLRTSERELAVQFANAAVTLIDKANPAFWDSLDPFGLRGTTDDPKAFKKAKYKGAAGYAIAEVDRGGPAEKAGIRAGDIITSWNGEPWGPSALANIGTAARIELEPAVDLLVFRDGKEIPLRLKGRNVRLMRKLAVDPPKLGLYFRDVAAGDQVAPGREKPSGVFVNYVTQTTLADRMNFRAGDIIVELNGIEVANGSALDAAIAAGPVSSAKVLRAGTMVELRAPQASASTAAPQRLGLGVRELPASGSAPGYLEVVTVEPMLAAAKLDLRVGDKLLEVNGKPVATTADLAQAVSMGPVVSAKVERNGQQLSLGGVVSF
jgi:S1-C subfamily serine protease